MRSFLAGLLILSVTSCAFAQVRGEVESIGFGGEGYYRPECWTPMVIRLKSQISDPAEYRIEVHQQDLDFDHVIYVKDGITLNGQAEQRWEVCFLPQPTKGGLADPNSNNPIQDLQDKLRVYLTNKEGTRQLLQLPITSPVQSLEVTATGFTRVKGNKLILSVTDGSSRPAWSEYAGAIGLIEKPVVVPTDPRSLPQSVLAYQAVDAVIWMSGDAHILTDQGSKQLAAIHQWVRQGGSLVVCQPAGDGDRKNIAPFADLLPILWQDNGEWRVSTANQNTLQPLITLAQYRNQSNQQEFNKHWKLKGEFPFARAIAKPDAVVDEMIAWDGAGGKDVTPYMARMPCGLGCVTWVAQDLGNRAITGPDTTGWPYVWDKVFGWRNDTRIPQDQTEVDRKAYEETFQISSVDLGYAQLRGVEFGAKGAGLIVLAIFFFIVYWIVAGPGTYLVLTGRHRKELSWTAFGVTAMVATLITVLLVRLVLRGSAEIHHATDLRVAEGQEAQPAIAYSRIGLYIPRDGAQRVSLAETSSQLVSWLTPMSISPSYLPDNEFPANLDYQVPVREEASADPVAIEVPFRSTLKKLQAKWCGDKTARITGGAAKLTPGATVYQSIQGSLGNGTGVDLKNVYFAFHFTGEQDYMLYVPLWPKGSAIDLGRRLAGAYRLRSDPEDNSSEVAEPGSGKDVREYLESWAVYWGRTLSGVKENLDDLNQAVPISFPALSLFDRLPPIRNNKESTTSAQTLFRRGARNLNMSQALMAGELVVLAQADNQPLPFPLDVNGDRVEGVGTVFYQFALPLERVSVPRPVTKPATQPPG